MKNILSSAIVLVFLMLGSSATFAQDCDSNEFSNKALEKLKGDFTFIKSFKIDGRNCQRKDIEYTCVFSKDTQYKVVVEGKDGGAQGIVVELYDSKRKKITSSLLNGKFYPGFVYICRATGIYYLKFSFQDSHSCCGGAVLGFKR